MKGKSWRILKDLVMIFVASLIYGAGISLFLDPNNLAPGGVSGVAVILNRLSGIDTGTLYLLVNIPIILVGIWKFGLRFMGKTMYAVILTSWATNILTPYGPMTTDPLLAALTGSVLLALGIGMVFKAGATTGGVDIIVKLLRKRYRHLKTGFLFECTDLLIVACSGLVFRNINTILYALIAVLVSGAALDYVLYGGDEAKMIISLQKSRRDWPADHERTGRGDYVFERIRWLDRKRKAGDSLRGTKSAGTTGRRTGENGRSSGIYDCYQCQ